MPHLNGACKRVAFVFVRTGDRLLKMQFRPFGDSFEVYSPLKVEEAKSSIRKRLRPWFDLSKGARGWIAGPVICLWLSAVDQQGPSLLGIIRPDGSRSRLSGVAGLDLLGGLYALAFGAALVALLSFRPAGDLISIGLVSAFIMLGLFLRHLFRNDAKPLVRFLESAVGQTSLARARIQATELPGGLQLTLNGVLEARPAQTDRLLFLIDSLTEGEFVILSRADGIYVQTACEVGGFLVEMRNGGPDSHLVVYRPDGEGVDAAMAVQLVLAWATEQPEPEGVAWRGLHAGTSEA